MATYYVSSAGSNSSSGISPASAWQTIAKVNAVTLNPGDAVYFRMGDTFSDAGLVVGQSGTSTNPITIGSYGSGAQPIIDGGGTNTTFGSFQPITVNGSWVTIQDIQVQHSSWAGMDIFGTDCRVLRCTATHNLMGVLAENTAHRVRVLFCNASNNTLMYAGTTNTDDVGAIGVGLLACDSPEIGYCTLSNNLAVSPDFGYDGSGVEIYGTTNALIHHNMCVDSETFSELGGSQSNLPANNTFYDNVIIATNYAGAKGIYVHGADGFGPASGTVIQNNTIYLTGASSFGFGSGTGDVVFQNNVVWSPNNIGSTDVNITEGNNVYYGGGSNNIKSASGAIAASSATADPLFVSVPNNLKVQAGSPAINRGTAVSYITDYAGQPRTNGTKPDAGAYENVIGAPLGWRIGSIDL